MIYGCAGKLVEEGLEAVLNRKKRATPAVARIFDGEKEAKTDCPGLFKAAQGTHASGP